MTRSASTTGTDLTQLAVALERTASWLRRASRPAEWNAVAMSTLDALSRTGPQRVSDLVAQERITQPGMTGLVARLTAAGLVERSPDPRDGRATLVAITPAGREHIAAFHDSRARTVAAHIRNLPAEQQQALLGATAALTVLAAQPITEGEDA